MNPLVVTFLKLTAIVAIVLIALWLAAAIFKFVVIAAIVAAVILGGAFLYNLIRRSRGVAP